MYYIYLLQDLEGKLYVGYSADLKRRLREHNQKKTYTTRRMRTPKLIYYEAYLQEAEAKLRERKLKQYGSSYHGLIKRLKLIKSNK
jgi:putative endonuclease